jgi:hypothetical protein
VKTHHNPNKNVQKLYTLWMVLLTIFRDAKSNLLLEFLDHGAPADANHYCTTMQHMKEAIQRK